jgi:hypothetical protein
MEFMKQEIEDWSDPQELGQGVEHQRRGRHLFFIVAGELAANCLDPVMTVNADDFLNVTPGQLFCDGVYVSKLVLTEG